MRFKKGDSFSYSGTMEVSDSNGNAVQDLTGWTGASWIADKDNRRIATLAFSWINAAERVATISELDTSGWPEGLAYIDIQLTDPSGIKVSTDIETIEIYTGVTGSAT